MSDDTILQAMDNLFSVALFRADCPPPETLLRYQVGLLDGREAQPVVTHLATCDMCQAELAELAAPVAPSPLVRAVEAGVRLLRAALQPLPAAPAMALRGAEPRRLEYRVESYQIILAVTPAPGPGGAGSIEGQISGAETALASEEGAGRLVGEQHAVAPGMYAIELRLGNDQLLIEGVAVG
jgi:anti-sigma factor RsiW